LTHSIPCALDSPPLLHSYLACGAALLSKPGSVWAQVAINHYTKAVNLVRDALRDYKHHERNEWLLGTVNALHIFEVINPL
jgi:Fungal specific transcription factor domain